MSNYISDETAFRWWVKETLCCQDMIISKVKPKYWCTSHKFGISIPKTIDKVYKIERQPGTEFWTKAIVKEMENARL